MEKKEKNDVHTAISVEDVVKKLAQERDKILEQFAKAYLAESGLLPSQVELVTQQLPIIDGKIENIYFFRKKT